MESDKRKSFFWKSIQNVNGFLRKKDLWRVQSSVAADSRPGCNSKKLKNDKSAIKTLATCQKTSPVIHRGCDLLSLAFRIKDLMSGSSNFYHELRRKESLLDQELETRTSLLKEQFRQLTNSEKKLVVGALQSTSETIADKFDLVISHHDIKSLRPKTWLNDLIIDFYYQLIAERGFCFGVKVHACSTFFYKKLLSSGYESIKKWTKGIDIFSFDLVILPIHLPGHWCFASIDFRCNRIQYFDSLGGSGRKCLGLLMAYLESESLDKRKTTFDSSTWEMLEAKEIPRQQTGYDCGVFACIYAEYLTRGEPFTFSQTHMPYFRERIICEIIAGRLFNS